jgi:hypothetical protein
MNAQPASAVQQRERNEAIYVVTPDKDRFLVYNARDPGSVYHVSWNAHRALCTCPEFQANQGQPDFRCGHIHAVFPRSTNGQPALVHPGNGAHQSTDISPVQMTLKRSVSPDGRIDSLSVEFAGEVYDAPDEEVLAQALRTTTLQTAIVNGFLAQQRGPHVNRSQANEAQPPVPSTNGTEQEARATLTTIDGMQTKAGWRYFINVDVDGKQFKLFGTRDQLASHLRDAGLGHAAGNIAKGVAINMPCRAITCPSKDGRYVNVERLLPVNEDDIPF